ncbi:hypothetical protein [Mesorhizobium sp. WSM2561]|uniref:hypothetical protein n=1 Tax=Mesorhizobium sp. WSM2561 TaxID=1040985 RepID=UPI0004863C27|nr:hypothetical protein [Mesorhizobium sp. WSM2561]
MNQEVPLPPKRPRPKVTIPQPLGLYAGDLLVRTREYFEAFNQLGAEAENAHLFARYFLFFHALELLLKAFLASKGVSKRDLRLKYGHSIEDIYDAAVALGMHPLSNVKVIAKNLDVLNSQQDFRYPSGYNLHVQSPAFCRESYEALRMAIEPRISTEVQKASLQLHSDFRGQTVIWKDE